MNRLIEGIVQGRSANLQRFAILTDYGYTIVDVEHGELSRGDVVTGSLDEHGCSVLSNLTTGRKVSVSIDAIQATKAGAESLLCCK